MKREPIGSLFFVNIYVMKHVLLFENYIVNQAPTVYYHGTTNKGFFGKNGIHIGTKLAATQALESRIGVPAEGEWDGSSTYGERLLAGRITLGRRSEERGYSLTTGYNCGSDLPKEDYYAGDRSYRAKYSDYTEVALDSEPIIFPVEITGKMKNSVNKPYSDRGANNKIARAIKDGNTTEGFYYINDGEDAGSLSAVVPNGSFLKVL